MALRMGPEIIYNLPSRTTRNRLLLSRTMLNRLRLGLAWLDNKKISRTHLKAALLYSLTCFFRLVFFCTVYFLVGRYWLGVVFCGSPRRHGLAASQNRYGSGSPWRIPPPSSDSGCSGFDQYLAIRRNLRCCRDLNRSCTRNLH
jgi:hypothetical protein